MEYKKFAVKLTDVDGKGKFTAMLATNGNVDKGFDRFMPGTWKKTINDRGSKSFPLLWVHDHSLPVGSFRGTDIKEGLLMDGTLNLTLLGNGNPVIPEAFKAYALYGGDNPDLDGMSVGYSSVSDKIDFTDELIDGKKVLVRNMREAKLHEGSFAPVPMNDLATMQDMKGGISIFEYVTMNLKNKDFKFKILSLCGLEPDLISTLMEPEAKTTHRHTSESFYDDIYRQLNGGK